MKKLKATAATTTTTTKIRRRVKLHDTFSQYYIIHPICKLVESKSVQLEICENFWLLYQSLRSRECRLFYYDLYKQISITFLCLFLQVEGKRKLFPNKGLIPKVVPYEVYLEMAASSPPDNVTTGVVWMFSCTIYENVCGPTWAVHKSKLRVIGLFSLNFLVGFSKQGVT